MPKAKKIVTRKKIADYFYFHDKDEFVIFMVWGLFVSAFLLTFLK